MKVPLRKIHPQPPLPASGQQDAIPDHIDVLAAHSPALLLACAVFSLLTTLDPPSSRKRPRTPARTNLPKGANFAPLGHILERDVVTPDF